MPLSPPPHCWDCRHMPSHLVYDAEVWVQTQVLTHLWEAPYQRSHLPSPRVPKLSLKVKAKDTTESAPEMCTDEKDSAPSPPSPPRRLHSSLRPCDSCDAWLSIVSCLLCGSQSPHKSSQTFPVEFTPQGHLSGIGTQASPAWLPPSVPLSV